MPRTAGRCERLLNKLEDCPMSNTHTPHLDATSGTITVGVLVNVVIDLDKWNDGFGGKGQRPRRR